MSERVYSGVKEAILSGSLAPGSRLVELILASEYGVSRTPVREALKRLESETLTVNHPVRGMVVKPIGRREIEDFYTIRETLDGLAAKLAARRISRDDVLRLQTLVEAMDEAAHKGRGDLMVQINLHFHEIILDAAGNQWLIGIGGTLRDFVRRLSTDAFRDRKRDLEIAKEHRNIADALDTGNPKAAAAAAVEHMVNAREHFVRRSALSEATDGAPNTV